MGLGDQLANEVIQEKLANLVREAKWVPLATMGHGERLENLAIKESVARLANLALLDRVAGERKAKLGKLDPKVRLEVLEKEAVLDRLVVLEKEVHLDRLENEVKWAAKVEKVTADQLEFLARQERRVPLAKKETKVMWVPKVITGAQVRKVIPEHLVIQEHKERRVVEVHQVQQVQQMPAQKLVRWNLPVQCQYSHTPPLA